MIRAAVPSDYPAIADLQIASWRSAYRDRLPTEYLGEPVHADVMGKWLDFAPGPRDILLVSDTGNAINGFVYVMGGEQPYIDNLHVDPAMKRSGIGTELMRATAQALLDQGDKMVWLTVMTENLAAVGFYEKIGGQRGELRHDLLYGLPVQAYPMTWVDLPALANFGQ